MKEREVVIHFHACILPFLGALSIRGRSSTCFRYHFLLDSAFRYLGIWDGLKEESIYMYE